MRFLLLLATFLIGFHGKSQVSLYSCGSYNPDHTQSGILNGPQTMTSPCFVFGSPNQYNFTGNISKKLVAGKEIHLKPDFNVGNFSSQTAEMWFQVQPQEPYDIAIINYPNLDAIKRLEKMELGIKLPLDVNTKILNFINKQNVASTQKINPYIATKQYAHWDNAIRVFAEFYHPEGMLQPALPIDYKNASIDGFYFKDFEVWNHPSLPVLPAPANGDDYTRAEYESLGGWNEVATDYPFRIRFTPRLLGRWKFRIKVEINSQLVYTSPEFETNVVENDKKDYITVGKRYLMQDQKTFFPIGINHVWPEADRPYDNELAEHFSYTLNGEYKRGNEGYRDWYVRPGTYEKYHQGLDAIVDNGGNYVRTIMYPSATDIEWEEAGNYTDRLHMAQELDKILEHAEARDLYIHWDMQTHFSFQQSIFAYYRHWCWDSQSSGKNFCYRDLTNSNFAPDFFTHAESKAYYKERLRYILARWGYSTHVAVLELFCEINNVGTNGADNNEFYADESVDNYLLFKNWQIEMAAYLKSHYHGRIHPVTSSLTGEKHDKDDTYKNPNFDLMTQNIYDLAAPNFSRHWYTGVNKHNINEDDENSFTYNNIKPFFISEGDAINSICDFEKVEMRRFLWHGLFSGAAGVLSWEMRYFPQVLPELGRMRAFIEKYPLEEGDWHPGSMDLDGDSWRLNDTYADNMDGDFLPYGKFRREARKADLSYLRSGDRNYAIGVVTNKTYGILTVDDCFDQEWQDLWEDADTSQTDLVTSLDPADYKPAIDVSCLYYELKLRNMKSEKYYINFFKVTDLNTPIQSEDDGGLLSNGKVDLEYIIKGDYLTDYIILFTARKKNTNHPQKSNQIEDELLEEEIVNQRNVFIEELEGFFKVFPNPVSQLLTIEKPDRIDFYHLVLKTIDGKVLYSNKHDSNFEINMENLTAGIYFIDIHQSNGEVITFKIQKS